MSDGSAPVTLVFLWHHHQPDYRSPRDGRALLPWVRLHASKDYLDMALHLERHPAIHATFNFVPSLLDQLEAAASGSDELFDQLVRPVESLSLVERTQLALRCVSAPHWALERWPRYQSLRERVRRATGGSPALGDPELLALETYFLLAWIDPLHSSEPEAARAIAQTGPFTARHRDDLLTLHGRLLAAVLPAYRRLAARGQIELSASPYFHPILPLLVDLRSARRAMPEVTLPLEPFAAPEDAEWQVARGLERHEHAFGARPAGMWPSEGSVSPEATEIAARAGVRWLASDEGVLWRSLPPESRRRAALYRPWQLVTGSGSVSFFFRDRELSDRIGFVYQRWDAREAAADFVQRLRRIAHEHPGPGSPVVSVILDGENCWEQYSEDGGPFLEALYETLEQSPDIRTRTPSEVLAETPAPETLAELHSGSWIDADFHIWIGHPEKNRAWDLIARARLALLEANATPESHPDAWRALYAAEGSDWFWWFGEDHFTPDKAIFDRIFREHLQAVYERAGLAAPGWVAVPVVRLRGPAAEGSRPLGFVRPTLDGEPTNFYEWHGAGRYRLGASGGATHRGAGFARELYFGFDRERLYLRVDFNQPPPAGELDLVIEILAPRIAKLAVRGLERGERPVQWLGGDRAAQPVAGAEARLGSVLELGVPFESLGLSPGQSVELIAQLTLPQGEPIEVLPHDDVIRFNVPDAGYEAEMWSA